MRKGKEKCEILKAIRAYVADKYGIEYTPSECNHKGECRGTCPKCDAELAELQEKLEAQGIANISEDTKLSDMVEKYLSKLSEEVVPALYNESEGMPIPLQGDVAPMEETGLIPYVLEGDVDAHYDDKRLFMQCSIAGISFHDIDDIWNELQVGTKLALVREKNNTYDHNAIAVALAGDYDGDPDEFDFDFILGYIPRKDNEILAAMLDMGWEDAFETEICELNEHAPYSDRIHIAIYIKNKRNDQDEQKKDNRLRMMIFRDEEKWESLSNQLWQKGYSYFRWGGFPPWETNLPKKGDKVVFVYLDGSISHLYLMQTIAVGDNEATPFVESIEELDRIDDCTVYVLTNVVGPIVRSTNDLQLPKGLLHEHWQPDELLPQELSDSLTELFALDSQFKDYPSSR